MCLYIYVYDRMSLKNNWKLVVLERIGRRSKGRNSSLQAFVLPFREPGGDESLKVKSAKIKEKCLVKRQSKF